MPDDEAMANVAIASIARLFEVVLEQHGLTIQKYRVLKYLMLSPVTPSDLAYLLTVRPPTVTRLVDGVVSLGLVSRGTDEADGRRTTLELTYAGRQMLVDADASILESLDRISSELAPRDRETARRGLELWALAMTRYWARTHPDAQTDI